MGTSYLLRFQKCRGQVALNIEDPSHVDYFSVGAGQLSRAIRDSQELQSLLSKIEKRKETDWQHEDEYSYVIEEFAHQLVVLSSVRLRRQSVERRDKALHYWVAEYIYKRSRHPDACE